MERMSLEFHLGFVSLRNKGQQNFLHGRLWDGSTSEFSADAPMKPPFDLFIQGGSHRAHVKIALIHALSNLFQAGLIKLPQND